MDEFNTKIESLIESHSYLAVGETKPGEHSSFFQNLSPFFPKFQRIFLELPINYQSSINYFLYYGQFDEALEGLIYRALNSEGADLRETSSIILNSARENRIPIVCIDSSKVQNEIYRRPSAVENYFLRGESRDADMFNAVTAHFPEGKSLIIGGAEHVKYGTHSRTETPTLGQRMGDSFKDKYFNLGLINENDSQLVDRFRDNFDELILV